MGFLVLTRRLGESIVINDDILVMLARISEHDVRLAIAAPPGMPVHRREVWERKPHPARPEWWRGLA